ncbi:hypothetical protein [Halotia branconii]|uniref:Uncharacterized protein n=1 Tax=Halotia branconii CENA392 TaxID=1539056 RepID=A0AAJ6NYM9_9CYAN|nr:hypothetical protein [Halotia branconii]WGV29042.1 hypothetical protein QI031_31275 [Halotia branconii CENA392]
MISYKLGILTPDTNTEIENNWFLDRAFNSHVDFCIWVLKIDGLKVPPFDQHPNGSRILQDKGMDVESWRLWLNKVVATQDYRLHFEVSDLQSKVEEELASLQALTAQMVQQDGTLPVIDWSAVRSSLTHVYTWKHELYRQAVQQLGSLSPQTVPPDVWQGKAEIKNLLNDLWQNYQLLNNKTNTGIEYLLAIENRLITEDLYSQLEQYRTHLKALQIFLVNYPSLVEYIVPPFSAILSLTDEAPLSEQFQQRSLRVAEALSVL